MSNKNVQILNFNHNIVEIGPDNKIVITDQIKGNNITIPQPVTNILQINSPGPQGPVGPAGSGGGGGISGDYVTTSSFNSWTGSSASQFAGTASRAITASHALNIPNTSSLLQSSSFNSWTGSSTSQFAGTASYATTALNALNAPNVSGLLQTSSFNSWTGSSTSQFAGTASYATTALNVNLTGLGITVNGTQLTASVRTVNGASPINGNVAVSLSTTYTGFSSSLSGNPSLQASASGPITASFPGGALWIVTGETNPARTGSNGETYIYASGSVGQWISVPNYSQNAADARYLQLNGGTLVGDITMNSGVKLSGTASFAITASHALNVPNTSNLLLTSSFNNWTGSNLSQFAGTSSYTTTASYALNGGTTINTGSLVATSSFNSFTSSYNTFTSSYNTGSFSGSLKGIADTASYYQETDPIFTAKSASLATTGSNVFKGNQTLTGSLTINNGSLKIDTGTSVLTAEPTYRKVLTITGSQINDLYADTGAGVTPQGVVVVDGIPNKVLIPTKIITHAQLQVPVVGSTTVSYFGYRVFNFELSKYEYISIYRTSNTFKVDTTYTFAQASSQQEGLLDGNNLNYPYLTFPSGNPITAWVVNTSIRDADFSNLSSLYFVRFYVYYMIAPVSLNKSWIYG